MLDATVSGSYHGPVERVEMQELKKRLSEFLERVDGGEVFLITDRGRPVAELRKPGPVLPPAGWEGIEVPSGLWDLVARGVARLGTPPGPRKYEMPAGPPMPAGTAQALIDWDRGDR